MAETLKVSAWGITPPPILPTPRPPNGRDCPFSQWCSEITAEISNFKPQGNVKSNLTLQSTTGQGCLPCCKEMENLIDLTEHKVSSLFVCPCRAKVWQSQSFVDTDFLIAITVACISWRWRQLYRYLCWVEVASSFPHFPGSVRLRQIETMMFLRFLSSLCNCPPLKVTRTLS